MKSLFSKRNIYILGGVIVLGLIWYFFFSGSTPATDDLLSSTPAASEGDQLLTALNQIKSLTLNADIFSNPSFENLTDSSVTLTPETPGRPNPFAPLPAFTPSSTSTNLLAGSN